MTRIKMAPGQIVAEHSKCSALRRQLALPTGFCGWLVGQYMAVKNARMNHLAVELLDVQPDDCIIEIGFGPGIALALLATRAPRGFIAGIDPSNVMVRQATRRNRRAVQTGQMEVRQGTASHLPYGECFFDKVLAVNNFHHWTSPEHDLLEVRRVLREGGMLLWGMIECCG